MSLPEVQLWNRLRGLQGIRVRRQHPIGPYVLDFYCVNGRIAIEVDGEQHGVEECGARDERRDTWLRAKGIEIVRVPARDVLTDTDAAALSIVTLIGARLPPPSAARTPPPAKPGEDR